MSYDIQGPGPDYIPCPTLPTLQISTISAAKLCTCEHLKVRKIVRNLKLPADVEAGCISTITGVNVQREEMSYQEDIEFLEFEWTIDVGFFYFLRQGLFDESRARQVIERIKLITVDENVDLPYRLVSLLWNIPRFLDWQDERVQKQGGDMKIYSGFKGTLSSEIERLLGLP